MNKAEAQNLWMKAIHRILWGLALCSITLGFYGLNYILPAVGILLVYSGFYTLRYENKWFGRCFNLHAFRTAYYFLTVCVELTTDMECFPPASAIIFLNVLFSGIFLAEIYCFGRGIEDVQEKVGIAPHAGGVFCLIPWNIATMCWMSILSIGGADVDVDYTILLIAAAAMVIIYILVLFSIDSLAGAILDEGYCVQTEIDMDAEHKSYRKKSEIFLTLSVVMYILGGAFFIYVFNHPEDSWAISVELAWVIYLVYFLVENAFLILGIRYMLKR